MSDVEQRLVREINVARAIVSSLVSQRPHKQPSDCGWLETTDGGKVAAFDVVDGPRRFRVFVVEVMADGMD